MHERSKKKETYKETYTIDDVYALPEGERAELILIRLRQEYMMILKLVFLKSV